MTTAGTKNKTGSSFFFLGMRKQTLKQFIMGVIIFMTVHPDLKAQYGEVDYVYNGAFCSLTSATIISTTTGFIQAGAMPTASGNQMDLRIIKTDPNGQVSPGYFENEYYITGNTTCSGPGITNLHGCVGVDIIPTTVPAFPPIAFMATGAYGTGIFVMALDANGNILWQRHWSGNNNERPAICESATTPGVYYVCGTTGGLAFAMKIDWTGSSPWSRIYSTYPGKGRDIIHSPYNPNELIMVGRCDVVTVVPPCVLPPAAEAFFMTINEASGAAMNLIGYSDCSNGDEWFNSIKIANSPTGGNGFIVSGRMFSFNPNYSGYIPWMLKLDPNGNVIWSTVIADNSEITEAVERQNTFFNTYEYFGISRTPNANGNQMSVWKLDDFGNAVASPNRFNYSLGINFSSFDVTWPQINAWGTGPGTGDGLVAWATDLSNNMHVMVKAYYNGVDGCENSTDMSYQKGPGISFVLTQNSPMSLTSCLNRQVNLVPGNPITQSNCPWQPFVPGGSNFKATAVTGLQEQSQSDNLLVFPNPTNGSVLINLNTAVSGFVNMAVTNALGQKVYAANKAVNTDGSGVSLDFASINVPNGVYFVSVTAGTQTFTKKVMYTK